MKVAKCVAGVATFLLEEFIRQKILLDVGNLPFPKPLWNLYLLDVLEASNQLVTELAARVLNTPVRPGRGSDNK